MISIDSAFQAYLVGDLDGWDLMEVVQEAGYTGFTVTKDKTLKLHHPPLKVRK